ncbi:MAG: NAD-dependent deacylase [Spirochaetota bacterium]
MENNYREAAEIIKKSKNLIALSGAGHSVESGIPDFRGKDGLWTKYDPAIYAHIEMFRMHPEKTWEMLAEMQELTGKAKPNAGHIALARLEEIGILKAVITQNIDNLHQAAGSKHVIEFHGNSRNLKCLDCGMTFSAEQFRIEKCAPPRCKECGSILKPTVIFFGENIPHNALMESMRLADIADAVMVIGTSAQVFPAASIPYKAKENGATIIEMNLEKTALTDSITDIFIEGLLGKTLPELLRHVESK